MHSKRPSLFVLGRYKTVQESDEPLCVQILRRLFEGFIPTNSSDDVTISQNVTGPNNANNSVTGKRIADYEHYGITWARKSISHLIGVPSFDFNSISGILTGKMWGILRLRNPDIRRGRPRPSELFKVCLKKWGKKWQI